MKLIDNIFFFSGISKLDYFGLRNTKDCDLFLNQVNLKRGVGYDINRPEENEDWFIRNRLASIIRNEQNVNLFDVGANRGQFLKKLSNNFNDTVIYSFEPNPFSFQILERNFKKIDNIKLFQLGFADISGELCFYTKVEEPDSELASLSKEVFLELHNEKNLKEITVDVTTLDSFCDKNQIGKIDFLKIDTEGYELKILLGGKKMIEEGRISIIQFEFNEMNVISRVFLKDFYKLLFDYNFYRIGLNELIPLGKYLPDNEIFKYQNIVAIRNFIKT